MIADNETDVKIFTAGDLLRYCWRGGAVGIVWRAQGRQSQWLTLGELDYSEFDQDGFDRDAWQREYRKLPKAFWGGDVYFGVNPSAAIPPQNKRGNTDQRYIAAQTDYLACTNVLFAEFDGKGFVDGNEYRQYLPDDYRRLDQNAQREAVKIAKEIAFYFSPDKYKARAMKVFTLRVNEIDLPPTVIVDSGGGYHAYWFLRDTVYIDDENRADVAQTQHDWVQFVGGDPGAADLRRVLRIPGWLNCKDGWGSNKPVVTIVHYDAGAIYDYAEIEQTVGDWAFENNRRPVRKAKAGGSAGWDGAGMGEVRRQFDQRYRVVDLLTARGWTVCSADDSGFTRLARPGKEGVPSVSVLPATENMPEIAYHHSGNDDLHADQTKRTDENGVERRGLDAYLIYVHLWHQGNQKTAWIAAKKILGLWIDRDVEIKIEAA